MASLLALPTYEPCTLQFKMAYAIFDLIGRVQITFSTE